MKNILCFGDSNTFGTDPAGGRHARNVRWTGRLQQLLGEEYYVIEEGMGGRNTVWDDPIEPMRNGSKYLPISLQSHQPLDLVILFLGTNDCKCIFPASPRVIASGVETLCNMVDRFAYKEGYPVPQILVVSPILIGEAIEHSPFASYDYSSCQKSYQLAPLFESIAARHGYLFLDAAQIARPSELDQLHLDAGGHQAVAEALYGIITDFFTKGR